MDSAVKQRAVIEFLVKLGEVSPTKIHDKLCAVYQEETMSVSTLRRWVLRFRNGEESISDKPRSGRPSSASTPETVEKVNGLIMQNRRIRVRDLAMQVGCSTGTIVNIINQLNYRKVCARWVPKLLTQEQKDARRDISSDLLRAYRNAGEEFFRGTVTGDESWIHHYQPETRRQSMEWKHPGSPAPKKVKSVTSAGKIMVTIFWDEDGVLLVDFLEHGRTMNSDRYITVLRRLRRAIVEKRRDLDVTKITIHHDNARPHTSHATCEEIARLGWNIMPQPPYSPDLAPTDFHLFGPLKDDLRGEHFETDADVMCAVKKWAKETETAFFRAGFRRWPERWEKCVQAGGDWFEA